VAIQLFSLTNKTVLVAIPALFGDVEARRCQIAAAEAFGVWLVSKELSARVLPHAERERDKSAAALPIFVPFAQIAAIVPLPPTASATAGLKPASASSAASATSAASAASPQASATTTVRAANARTKPAAQSNPAKPGGPAGA
jgi:hypothetical protein